MLVRIFTFFCILVSALDSHAVNSILPAPDVFKIKSEFSQRSSFDSYFYRAPKSKGVVVYLYGGGCLFPANEENLELYEVGKKIVDSGYSLYIPHYRQFLEWDTEKIPSDKIETECNQATLTEIADIKSSINFLSKILGQKNIFVWGHSFGAFLVNILALEKPENPVIKGYISSNGWWNVTKDYWGLWMLSPMKLNPMLQNPSNLSKILVVHTRDDERIPFSQIEYFEAWVSRAQIKPNYKLVVFPTGGHSYIKESSYPTDEFLKYVLEFLSL